MTVADTSPRFSVRICYL